MDLRNLTPDFAVTPQIEIAEVAQLAALGFRTLINNRPDGEIDPGLQHEAMQAAAAAAGLAYIHLPYEPGKLTDDLVRRSDAVLATVTGPVLAYCRSGTRSTHLWAMAQVGKRPLEEILDRAQSAGYDLTALVPMLLAKAASKARPL